MAVVVNVVYCGYGSRVRAFQSALMADFDDGEVQFSAQSTPAVTGFFEVTVNGQLVHSKKNGEGFPAAGKVAQIKATIEALLKK